MSTRIAVDDRIELLELYFLTKNYCETVRQCSIIPKPSRQAVSALIQKFYRTGSLLDNMEGRGRHRFRSEDFEDEVLESLEDDPFSSSRKRSEALGIPRTTMQRIITDLDYRPYRPHLLLDLSDEHRLQRVSFCETFLAKVKSDHQFLPNVWFSDECRFALDKVVNKQDCIYYAKENPHYSITISHSRKSLMVWCAISSSGIIGPIIFEDTVTAETYIKMLTEKFLPEVRKRERPHLIWFQQDGASSHTAHATREFLNRELPNKWIGLHGPITWPPKSPDLTPPDFFLWGYLKSKVYASEPKTLDELHESISKQIASIDTETCRKVIESVSIRLAECIKAEGDQIRQ